ncbi:MAG: hypothetical protein KDA87_07605 [Planctomycetales bacterium]|nr:hypothetical protein [Planctomycetales bacterium]
MKHPIIELLERDDRYKVEAYEFVRESLAYAQDKLGLGESHGEETDGEPVQRHLTGQQLCDASRQYALEQFGMMARVVLNNWGIYSTSDLGEVVYNLISVDLMKRSKSDKREDFDDVFDFSTAFESEFQISQSE